MGLWLTSLPFLHLIDWASKKHYHQARFEKESRYYVIRLSQDLLGDWVITLINGRIKSRLGQSRTLAFASFEEGLAHFCAQANLRNLRGYQLKTITCDNHLMLHLLPIMVYNKEKSNLPAAKTMHRINPSEHQHKKSASLLNKIRLKTASQQLGFAF